MPPLNAIKKDTGMPIPVSVQLDRLIGRNFCDWLSGIVLGNLKRAQQDGADESKRGAHRQHIQPQG
jgi:hypothetical protein